MIIICIRAVDGATDQMPIPIKRRLFGVLRLVVALCHQRHTIPIPRRCRKSLHHNELAYTGTWHGSRYVVECEADRHNTARPPRNGAGPQTGHIREGGIMAHAIGALGSSMDLRTKAKPRMTPEQRARNNALVPRKVRNQTRGIAFAEISRVGERPKYVAIRNGHLRHYQNAYFWATVEYVEKDGKRVVIPRPKK